VWNQTVICEDWLQRNSGLPGNPTSSVVEGWLTPLPTPVPEVDDVMDGGNLRRETPPVVSQEVLD
jgi:hypothetical protein